MRIRAEDGGRPVSALLCWAFGQWTVWLLMPPDEMVAAVCDWAAFDYS